MKTITMQPRQWIKRPLFVLILGFISFFAAAQVDPTDTLPDDPGAMSVTAIQSLRFGAFTHGNTGGSVVISNSGTRSVTGDVIPLNLGVQYYHAIFEIDAPAGSIISILNGPDATLTGSNGGSLSLQIGNADPASPFLITVPQPVRTPVRIGGTLTVGSPASNPPGTYTGIFYITFNQE